MMTNLFTAMENRHSVRSFEDRPLENADRDALEAYIDGINLESSLHFQLITNEPVAFKGLNGYGSFKNCTNYIALIGPKRPSLEEECGYWGEKIVLIAQMMGLNTCWVALTYKKVPGVLRIQQGDKLMAVIAVGYGATQGTPHNSKPMEKVCKCNEDMPEWFRKGVGAALLAPTACNQQKFLLEKLEGNVVKAKAGLAPYAVMDLGIVKAHFELAAGKETFTWAK